MRPTDFSALASMVTAEVRNAGLGTVNIQGFGALHDRTRFLRRHETGEVTIWIYTGRSAETIGADMVDGVAAAFEADPAVIAELRRLVDGMVADVDSKHGWRQRRPVWRSIPTHQKVLDNSTASKLE